MKKLNNKGFTLVEIVIVIVIIAILAAMLVPSLTAWIDKSKTKTFTSACGTIKTAVWSQAAEVYAVDGQAPQLSELDTADLKEAVGKPVALSAANRENGGYAITEFDYSAGKIVITDGTFTGTWSGTAATSWNVSK